MKNRILKSFIIVTLCLLSFGLILSSNIVKANSSYSGFKDFSFTVNRKIKYTGASIVWTVDINWKTEEEIKYLEVEMILEDGHKEAVYIDGRDNLAIKEVTKEDEYYVGYSKNYIKCYVHSDIDIINQEKDIEIIEKFKDGALCKLI